MKPVDILAVLAASLIWGLNFAAIKIGVGQFPPLFMTGLRFALVALVLLPFTPPPRGRMRAVALLSVTFGSLHFGLVFAGMTGVDASVAAVVVQLGGPFSVFFAWLVLGDRIGWWRGAGMAVAFLGVAILAGEPTTASSLGHLAMILGATVSWGLANVQIKRLGAIGVFQLNAWMALMAAPQLLLASALLEDGQMAAVRNADWVGWGTIVYAALAASVCAYGLWYRLIGRYELSRLAPFALLTPVAGIAAGVVVLGEELTWEKMVGGAVVLFGVAAVQLRRPRAAKIR